MKWFLEFIPGKIEFICGNRSRITADLEGYFKRSRRSCHQHCKRQQISVEFKRLMTIRLCEIHVILRKKSFSSSLRFTTILEWKARFVCYVNWQFWEPFLLIILWSIFAWLERVNIFGPYVDPGNFCRLNTQSTSMPPSSLFFLQISLW